MRWVWRQCHCALSVHGVEMQLLIRNVAFWSYCESQGAGFRFLGTRCTSECWGSRCWVPQWGFPLVFSLRYGCLKKVEQIKIEDKIQIKIIILLTVEVLSLYLRRWWEGIELLSMQWVILAASRPSKDKRQRAQSGMREIPSKRKNTGQTPLFLLWRGWRNPGVGCPERLWSLYPWSYWNPIWADLWVTSWSCFPLLDWMISGGPFQPQFCNFSTATAIKYL